MTQSPEAAILDLVGKAAAGKSVSPEDVARALDPEGWRRRLGQVRAAAVGLARNGLIVILRHGKPADPNTFKGVYRLRAAEALEPEDGSGPI
jgi:hypothetical protein